MMIAVAYDWHGNELATKIKKQKKNTREEMSEIKIGTKKRLRASLHIITILQTTAKQQNHQQQQQQQRDRSTYSNRIEIIDSNYRLKHR